jgi:hypothetical protein
VHLRVAAMCPVHLRVAAMCLLQRYQVLVRPAG